MHTFKKSLGQHFLQDENICRKIVAALQEDEFLNLIEVGPGGGALTKYLLQVEHINFKAVELDAEKVEFLIKAYPKINDRILNRSFLDIEKPFNSSFAIVGNFPYNISTQILFKILEWKEDVTCMVGMFQKEVAQRVASTEGSKVYGVLSVLVQAFFTVEYLFEVHENCFKPPPNVKSAVIRLRPLQHKPAIRSERAFFVLVKTAFNQRRKMLRNGVKSLFDSETLTMDIFRRRAEDLGVEEFAALTFKMLQADPLKKA
ncbi:MAG: 16S rRNA (adenine(1518)-N(6)/adenine(1519)-N(6))-dimethyltransferase RsmA [Chitinophagaceae bacterium]